MGDFINNNYELASYACWPDKSRGRLSQEVESSNRTIFQRDRDRIIHSTAFRRLEYKTQVFVNHEGDHYRTRLTHSLEVAQLARSIARSLKLNEDLAEAIALAHDLGHPPFGHAGEEALQQVMDEYCGFEHNAQTLRILTLLEQRYAEFDGLNLSWETLEGIAKHNGPVTNPHPYLRDYNIKCDLELTKWCSAEAQLASLADDIAYNNHDIDDGLRAGLFAFEELEHLPLVGEICLHVCKQYSGISRTKLTHEVIRRVINEMVIDLLRETSRLIREYDIQSVQDIYNLGRPVVAFSAEMQTIHSKLRDFLRQRMYRHYRVNRMTSKARRIVQKLFYLFMQEPECLPDWWQQQIIVDENDGANRAIIIADYIAGMTDRFAMQEYERLFDLTSRDVQG